MQSLAVLHEKYNVNQPLIFKILSKFTSLGAHARRFLLRAQGLECLLNYFYWENSPFREKFQSYSFVTYVNQVDQPEIGLPTAEDATARPKAGFALAKERLRMNKMRVEHPKSSYLVETIANLARSVHSELGDQKRAFL